MALVIEFFRANPGRPYLPDTVVINGRPVRDAWAARTRAGERVVSLPDSEFEQVILSHSFADVWRVTNVLNVPLSHPPAEFVTLIGIINRLVSEGTAEGAGDSPIPDGDVQLLAFYLSIPAEHWARPWSILEYADELRAQVEHAGIQGLVLRSEDDSPVMEGLSFVCEVSSSDTVIEDEIARWTPLLQQIMKASATALNERVSKDSLVTSFNFPPAVSAACQQYLLYFVQFLQDLGIEANAELKETADRVLFSVTPRSGPEALARIREALAAYLRLPTEPGAAGAAAAGGRPDIALLQLQANVSHLQSQLALGSALVQAKDATIEALHLSNYQLRQMQLQLPPAASAPRAEGAPEPLIGSAVKVTTYKKGMIEVDVPGILRALKRRFR